MSFSSEIKDELLNKTNKKINMCCIDAETFGEQITQINFKNELNEKYNIYFDIHKLKECCIKSILKGVFLGSGCIVDPNLDYHFEVTFKNKSCAEYFLNLLSVLEFTPKMLKRKGATSYTIYFKESDQISLFLSLIGTNKSVLNFEKVRVEKEVKNNINRTINCETANLAKVIKTSVKQIEAINKIKKAGKFDDLSDKLKFTANLRLKYPNESLDKISNITKETKYVSKSGLKHRLDKLLQIADTL